MEQVRDGQGQAGTGKNVQLSVHHEAEHELHKTMGALKRGFGTSATSVKVKRVFRGLSTPFNQHIVVGQISSFTAFCIFQYIIT